MNICLVTAFPPSRRGLNEYGYHIARELRRNPLLSVTILGDELPSPGPELPGFSVTRCWDFNRLSNPVCLLREIRRLQPDIVWFNIGFASYGNKALPATVGLTMPALVRLAGFRTHVTLHQLMDTVDLNDAVYYEALTGSGVYPNPYLVQFPVSFPGLDRSKLPTFLYMWLPDPALERLSGK